MNGLDSGRGILNPFNLSLTWTRTGPDLTDCPALGVSTKAIRWQEGRKRKRQHEGITSQRAARPHTTPFGYTGTCAVQLNWSPSINLENTWLTDAQIRPSVVRHTLEEPMNIAFNNEEGHECWLCTIEREKDDGFMHQPFYQLCQMLR